MITKKHYKVSIASYSTNWQISLYEMEHDGMKYKVDYTHVAYTPIHKSWDTITQVNNCACIAFQCQHVVPPYLFA